MELGSPIRPRLYSWLIKQISIQQHIGIYIAAILVNLPLVFHYIGIVVASLYLVCMAVFFFIINWITPHISINKLKILILFVICVSVFFQLYSLRYIAPQFNERMDRDSAITLFLSNLANGKYPYSIPTDQGNPISVLPGLPLIAAPFVLLGNVGYLEIFSYMCLIALLWNHYKSSPKNRIISIVTLSTSPLLFFEVIGRSDIIANMALLILFIYVIQAKECSDRKIYPIILGIILGILASTRLALLPSIVISLIYIPRRYNFQILTMIAGISLAIFIFLILPFFLWNPDVFLHYAPIGVNSTKLGTNPIDKIGLTTLTFLVFLFLCFHIKHPQQLFIFQIPLMSIIVGATWLTFFMDYSYLQFIFIPLLFIF